MNKSGVNYCLKPWPSWQSVGQTKISSLEGILHLKMTNLYAGNKQIRTLATLQSAQWVREERQIFIFGWTIPYDHFENSARWFTCSGASIGQVRRDGDGSALVHTHALHTFIDASEQPTLTEQGHFCLPSLMAVEEEEKGGLLSEDLYGPRSHICVASAVWNPISHTDRGKNKIHFLTRWWRPYLESNVLPSRNVAL